MPKLAKDNADRWFNIFGEALDSKKLRWIITGPEKADIHANSAVTLLLRHMARDRHRKGSRYYDNDRRSKGKETDRRRGTRRYNTLSKGSDYN